MHGNKEALLFTPERKKGMHPHKVLPFHFLSKLLSEDLLELLQSGRAALLDMRTVRGEPAKKGAGRAALLAAAESEGPKVSLITAHRESDTDSARQTDAARNAFHALWRT
jgi:hypothetical protein